MYVQSTYRALICLELHFISFHFLINNVTCFFRCAVDDHKAISATAAMNSLIGYMGDSHATSKLRENRLLR